MSLCDKQAKEAAHLLSQVIFRFPPAGGECFPGKDLLYPRSYSWLRFVFPSVKFFTFIVPDFPSLATAAAADSAASQQLSVP